MATSGTTNFQANRDQIITSALRKVGAIGEGETPSSDMLSNGVFLLETIIKEAHVDGMPLWSLDKQTIDAIQFVNGVYNFLDSSAPLKVIYAYYRQNKTDPQPVDIPMYRLTKYDFDRLSVKLEQGTPIQYHYDPNIQSGALSVWPIPDTYSVQNGAVVIVYQAPFEDAGTSTDTLDFPPYWNLALIYSLAWVLCPDYGVPPNDRGIIAKEAQFFRDRALSFGTEEGSWFIAPDFTYYK